MGLLYDIDDLCYRLFGGLFLHVYFCMHTLTLKNMWTAVNMCFFQLTCQHLLDWLISDVSVLIAHDLLDGSWGTFCSSISSWWAPNDFYDPLTFPLAEVELCCFKDNNCVSDIWGTDALPWRWFDPLHTEIVFITSPHRKTGWKHKHCLHQWENVIFATEAVWCKLNVHLIPNYLSSI